MLILHCFDDSPAGPGEKHGHLGPTHCATVGRNGTIEYPYQAEQWVIDLEADAPHVVRIECHELGRTWERVDGKFVETTNKQEKQAGTQESETEPEHP